MNRIGRDLLFLGVGCAAGVGLALLSSSTPSSSPILAAARNARSGADPVHVTQAHAETPDAGAGTQPGPAFSPPPAVSSVTPELETWLATLPIYVLRRAVEQANTARTERLEERDPRVTEPDEIERHAQAFLNGLLARETEPGFWVGDGSLSAGGQSYPLKLFLNFYSGSDLYKPVEIRSLAKPADLCVLLRIHILGLSPSNYEVALDCAGEHAYPPRDARKITGQWRLDPIENFYTGFAIAIPPFAISGAEFELFGAKDHQWSSAAPITWRAVKHEEFLEEEKKVNAQGAPDGD
jgi:hypothetical protein